MKKKITIESGNSTKKNTLYLTIGSAISQGLSLIGAFYIPRILGPENYGTYQIVITFVGMFMVFTFSGLNKVILRECSQAPDKARSILEETIGVKYLCSFGAMAICLLVLIFVNYDAGTKLFITIFSSSLLYSGMRDPLNIVYQYQKRMGYLSLFLILRTLISVSISILAVSKGFGVLSLVIIQIISDGVVLAVNFRTSRKLLHFNIFRKVIVHKKRTLQGITFTLIEFLNVVSTKIDLFMISFMGTPAQVGLYALAYNIVNKGLIVRQSLSQSIFPVYSELFIAKKLTIKIISKHTLVIAFISIIVITFINLMSEKVIHTLVGYEFSESISIINVLSYYLFFSYIIVPCGVAIQSGHKEMVSIPIGIVTSISNIFLNIIFFNIYGLIGIAYSTVITFFINSILLLIVAYRQFSKGE